jgi:regulator of cell morphogenesis and NO signaling
MYTPTINVDQPVSAIVKTDYRTADVFKKHGINYCCGGNATLKEACDIKKLNLLQVSRELDDAVQTINLPGSIRFDEWPVEFLIDYIQHVHHSYIKKTATPLLTSLRNFAEGHKAKYPHMMDVLDAFEGLHDELTEHLEEEETRIFPYLKQICYTYNRKETYASLFVRTMSRSLHKVQETEHRRVEAYIKQLRDLTHNYTFTPSVCTNHQVIYHKLKEFDEVMVQHKHLENYILFPKVIQMEQELLQQ